ncbi:hypothetical protein ACWCQW_21625 [Streptomyces mirabilis]
MLLPHQKAVRPQDVDREVHAVQGRREVLHRAAEAAGAKVLWGPYTFQARTSAIVQFPGGYGPHSTRATTADPR